MNEKFSKKFSEKNSKNFPKNFLKKYYPLLVSLIIIAVIITANLVDEKRIQAEEKIFKGPAQEITQETKTKKEKKETEVTYIQREAEKVIVPVHSTSSMKLWMDYRAITNTESTQWRLIQKAQIGNDGILRIDGYICVALGRNYGQLGDRFIFLIGNKKVRCIFTDIKADSDTLNGEGWLDPYGNILEIVVDKNKINNTCRQMGDMNYTDSLSGHVTKIWREVDK